VGYNTLRTMLNISAITGEKISQADIGNAYVESEPDEDTSILEERKNGHLILLLCAANLILLLCAANLMLLLCVANLILLLCAANLILLLCAANGDGWRLA
jgi:hypothetical protein